MSERNAVQLNAVSLTLCDLCLDGMGGECHTPGCDLWLNRAPDLPLRNKAGDWHPIRTGNRTP